MEDTCHITASSDFGSHSQQSLFLSLSPWLLHSSLVKPATPATNTLNPKTSLGFRVYKLN